MRILFFVLFTSTIIFSCKKGDGNSAPEIKFKSITENYFSNALGSTAFLTIEIKDKDGDVGFVEGEDTSYVYVKNITVSPFRLDSFKLPDNLANVTTKNFKAEIDVDLLSKSGSMIYEYTPPRPATIKRDTLFFEVYMKDFKKNKSNVIRTDKPLYVIRP
jgi:hypothetical protein